MNTSKNSKSRFIPFSDCISRMPVWLLAAVILGLIFLWKTTQNAEYSVILSAVAKGIKTTVWVSAVSYFFALLLGLLFGLMKTSSLRVIREAASFILKLSAAFPCL